MSKHILLLVDYRNQFYFSTKYRGACVDIEKLCAYLCTRGFSVTKKGFYELDLRNNDFKDLWVLYQSSEDTDLLYKDFIEDILLGLEMKGAKLIPRFAYFRAHHNKVFMEILRDVSGIPEIQNIRSHMFGTYEEYVKSGLISSDINQVIKPGSGTRSRGVRLLTTASDRKNIPLKTSKSFTLDNMKLLLSKLKTGKPFTAISNNRKKFIVQNFVDGLNGDYRILAYGNKYYVVFRKNRKNRFTASGSGKFDFDPKLPEGILEFAKTVYGKINTPYISLDIGYKDGKFFLFEFQCLCLGQYTLEKSKFYYTQSPGRKWIKVQEEPDLEREIADTVSSYIEKLTCVE